MKLSFPKKIPSLLGILLIGGLVYAVSRGSSQLYQVKTNAAKTAIPQNLLVTNVTDTSFTINWSTADPTIGAASVSTKNEKAKTFTNVLGIFHK